MVINIFGRIIEINIRARQQEKKNFKNNNYFYRILFILIPFVLFALLSEYRTIKSENYSIGSVLNSDIIAYKTISYNEDILDESLEKKIIDNTSPEYDRNESIEIREQKRFSDFLQQLSKIDIKSDDDIKKFIKEEGISSTVSDIRKMGIKSNVKYYIFLVDALSSIYDNGIYKLDELDEILSKKQIVLEDFEKNIMLNFLVPNLSINEEKTKKKIEDNINTLKNNVITINKGDIIAKKGDVVTPDIYKQLKEFGIVKGTEKFTSNIFTFVYIIIISYLIYYLSKKVEIEGIKSKGYYPSLITFIAINLIYQLLFYELYIFVIPFTVVSIITCILTRDKLYSIALSTLTVYLLAPNLTWFISMIIITAFAIYSSSNLTNRLSLVKTGFKIGAIQALFASLYGLIYNYNLTITTIMISLSLISGFLTGVICLGIIPYFENTFKILTDIKLLELGDYSAPLLKRLLLEAPGTFYHSIMVGALAEQAATVVGANPILARVGAYYHDIGKLKRPIYFVENQGGLGNLHNELKPSLSALILTSHPRDGYILAKQYGLPEEILNMIIEHHGTTVVQYFYYKAVEIGEHISEEDFKYSGPKPSTKESAIVMLADTVEAAVRASNDKSKEGIENTIRYLIKYKIDDNQLNDCDISIRDVDKIVEAFLKVLKAAYHERIQYPTIGKK